MITSEVIVHVNMDILAQTELKVDAQLVPTHVRAAHATHRPDSVRLPVSRLITL